MKRMFTFWSLLVFVLMMGLFSCRTGAVLLFAERNGRICDGKVVMITNPTDKVLHHMYITYKGSEVLVSKTLRPHDSVSVGCLELDGELRPGDVLLINCTGCRKQSYRVGARDLQ